MQHQELVIRGQQDRTAFTLRDFAIMAFRRKRVILFCFFGILFGAVLFALLGTRYKAETEFLVRRERVDPVITAEAQNPIVTSNAVSEEELNSEVELLRSDDVLRQVARATGLDKKNALLDSLFGSRRPEQQLDKAVARLRSGIELEVVAKSNVIRAGFSSSNPQLSYDVIKRLVDAYLDKHREVHHPAGQESFFDQQVKASEQTLASAEDQLKRFPNEIGTANPTLGRDIVIQKVNDFNATLGQTRAAIAETQHQINSIQRLLKNTPPRITTQMRAADNAPALQEMKATLLKLRLQRSDLAAKFQPDYPPLQELNRQIAQTEATVAAEGQLKDETTDQNPAYAWLNSELVKATADLSGYEAKANEIENVIRETLADARKLDVEGVQQENLMRNAKAAEESYLLYLRKREEARINDALNQKRILNVAVVEKPSLPSLPLYSPLTIGIVGLLLATTMSAGLAFSVEYFDTSFRTPAEIEAALNVPVLAAIPRQRLIAGNYNGHIVDAGDAVIDSPA